MSKEKIWAKRMRAFERSGLSRRAWLNASVTSAPVRRGPPAAWISTSSDSEHGGTLSMLAERLNESLTRHGIAIHVEPQIPRELERAELAIVAAHGGVGSGGRYFQVVADEQHVKMSAIRLSRAIRSAGVVILFVCSGGRFDKHPMSETVVALPKELLDQGCAAVVASPWPLDARVPSHWLPRFLEAWGAGEMLIDANHEANLAVRQAMGTSPEHCMAMTVYGNPYLVQQHPSLLV